MYKNKYLKALWFLVGFVLIMPFIGHMYGSKLGLKEIIFFGFPFMVLAGHLLFFIRKYSKEVTKVQFMGHLSGSILYFIPYFLLGFEILNSPNGPQGPGIFLYPLSAPIVLYVFYKPVYSLVTKSLQSPPKRESEEVKQSFLKKGKP